MGANGQTHNGGLGGAQETENEVRFGQPTPHHAACTQQKGVDDDGNERWGSFFRIIITRVVSRRSHN